MIRHRTTAAILLALLAAGAVAGTAQAAVPRIVFPVVAKTYYSDDFGAPRGTGSHQGNDIMARKKSRVVAAERGRVVKWTSSRNAGCMLYLHGRSGTTYLYIHLNNDRTMRNDTHGNSTCVNGIAYAPGLRSGQRVAAGQLVGYVGDSGDADGIAPHLHFELHPNDGRAVSPYRWLRAGWRLLYMRPPAATKTLALKISGRIVSKRLDTDPDRLTVQVARVRLSNGWGVRPARRVTVTVPSQATVARASTAGAQTTTLAKARIGERVVVRTPRFAQTLAYAQARAGAHAAAEILLRGS
ncbi:MAG TPA: M23 family metallopeptidase [Gaiellaceae bacterium]|nr:M23 family metallopeptidase [Gaiellaceae bacterium]